MATVSPEKITLSPDEVLADIASEAAKKASRHEAAKAQWEREGYSTTPIEDSQAIIFDIHEETEKIRQKLELEDLQQNGFQETIVRPILLEDGTLVPTIPDLTDYLSGEWNSAVYTHDDNGVRFQLNVTRADEGMFGVKFKNELEHPDVQLRLSGYLHAGALEGSERMVYQRDDKFIAYSVIPQTNRSLEQLVAAVRSGTRYILE